MVAVIKSGHSIHRILNYNENKVNEGVASCIGAVNYPKDLEDLSFTNKLNRLVHQAKLNENVSRKSVHISLNFPPAEKHSPEKLMEIASDYMAGIGFADQPYLVYEHMDAGHPHIHIVSIKVRSDGSRIDMNNIGRNQSEVTRKAIENKFSLMPAEHQNPEEYLLKPVDFSKLQYGKSPTKRAITNVLDHVIKNYKFGSLAEYNAILRQYNIVADRGNVTSRTYKNNGLTYRITDANGAKLGVPVKASDIYSQPTLKNLNEKFLADKQAKTNYSKSRIKNIIDIYLKNNQNKSQTDFKNYLAKQGIAVVFWQNQNGPIYGITYVDHQTKTVYNGKPLGNDYTAGAILKKLNINALNKSSLSTKRRSSIPPPPRFKSSKNANPHLQKPIDLTGFKVVSAFETAIELFDLLTQPEYIYDPTPYHLRARKKRRKKRKPI